MSQANDDLVSAYRKVEREDAKKALLSYLTICYREQVPFVLKIIFFFSLVRK